MHRRLDAVPDRLDLRGPGRHGIHVACPIASGELDDHADAARRLGLTRARLSQIAALLRLPLALQEGILLGTVRGSERDLRGRRRPARVRASRATVATLAGQFPRTPA